MRLKVKNLGFITGMPVCIIHEDTLREMNIHVGNRVCIRRGKKNIIAIVDEISKILRHNEIAVSEIISNRLGLKGSVFVDVEIAEPPHSMTLIKKMFLGKRLTKKEMFEIVEDIATNALTEAEVAFFVSAVFSSELSLSETKNLTLAMIKTGSQIRFRGKVVDKHCIGGVAGNRTTPLVVSICASVGLTIPKTSSRAITSAAGTADVIETIAKVDFTISEIKNIIKRCGACFVWGGALGLAPVDDKIIRIERIANVDSTSQLLASILSKKISVDSKYILIDIPYGRGAKVNRKQAIKLKESFLRLAKLFELKLRVVLTDGSEPVGRGVGPYFEMSDVLKVLERKKDAPSDLEEKSLFLAGELLELSGKAKPGKGMKKAKEILDSGRALQKFKEIVHAQKGDIKRLDSCRPKFSYSIKAKRKAHIRHFDNKAVNKLSRIAGSPEDKGSGVFLHKKKGETALKGEKIFTIFTMSKDKLSHAKKFFKENKDLILDY